MYYRAASSDSLSSLAPPGRTWTNSCAQRAPPSTPEGRGSLPVEMWQNGKIWQMARELVLRPCMTYSLSRGLGSPSCRGTWLTRGHPCCPPFPCSSLASPAPCNLPWGMHVGSTSTKYFENCLQTQTQQSNTTREL